MNDMTVAQPIKRQSRRQRRRAAQYPPRGSGAGHFRGATDRSRLDSNLHFPFAYAHNRLEDGGWAREVTVREMPAMKELAIVNMRLGPGVVRELHWHKEAEWAYITAGKARLTVVDADRHVTVDDLDVGDVWLVPSGVPHSIQGLEEGTEFVLVFDDGNFSENQTLLITEVMAHLPRSVVAKNFGVPEAAFKNLPKEEKYIFRLPVPAALDTIRKQLPNDPPPLPYVFHASKLAPNKFDGGSTKVIDHRQFPETSLSALIIDLEPARCAKSIGIRTPMSCNITSKAKRG
mgnify:CR=1 FL=1